MRVIKRDNTVEQFDTKRIEAAIHAAAMSVDPDNADYIAEDATTLVSHVLQRGGVEHYSVEEIQKCVEDTLMTSCWKDVATAYIEFRHDRDRARDLKQDLFKDVDSLINRTDSDLLSENANKDSRIIPTIKNLVSESVGKHFARKHILPAHLIKAHDDGDLHIHDLGEFLYPMFNCMLIDLETMLTEGFVMGNAKIETPRSILTACSIAAQVVTAVGSHIYGGNTLPELDKTLAPYVKASYDKHIKFAEKYEDQLGIKDKKLFARLCTERDTKDGIQALYYQVNTIVSSQGQTVFCTFTCGEGTSWEERLIQECILKQQLEGLGKDKKTFVFPKLVFQVRKGVNFYETDPNYDMFQLAAKCSAKRLYPDLLFMDTLQDMAGTQALPMGCRSFLAPWKNEEGETIYKGRNNLGVVTINLPRVAIRAKGDIATFWELLDEQAQLAREVLDFRIKRFEGVKAEVAPILYCSGAMGVKLDLDDNVMDIFKDGRSSISLGYLGIHETVKALFGEDVKEGHENFALDIVQFLRNRVDHWKEETGFGFSLYSTPAESLCYRFCKLDTELYGDIDDVTSKGYYTNSFHRTVVDDISVFEKAVFETDYPMYASGGFISYGEYPSMIGKEEALMQAWKYASEYQPYYGTNLPSDQCFQCGYEGEFKATDDGFECPHCGNTDEESISVIRRVTGYLGSIGTRPVNKGKHKEMQKRVKHY